MHSWQILTLAVAVVILIAAAALLIHQQRRSRRLRRRFGPEYDRTVAEIGNRRKAEADLERREERIRELKFLPLSAADRLRLSSEWMKCQTTFVEDPSGAVDQADRLISDVLRARGYSVANPYDRMIYISAAYARHADDYRIADEIVIRHRHGKASTEDLRKAFIHYRALFDEILGGRDEELKQAS